jgi:Carboxypeptidase regulatory-like domain
MAGTITGRVVNGDGTPRVGVAVSIAQSDQPHRDIAAITAADGAFRLNGLRPGTYLLEAHDDGLTGSAFVQLCGERASSVEISLG